MNPLKKYLISLTKDAREAFAAKAKTSTETLRVTAHGRNGKVEITPAFAARLEKASRGALPRTKLSPVCAACPHAKTK